MAQIAPLDPPDLGCAHEIEITDFYPADGGVLLMGRCTLCECPMRRLLLQEEVDWREDV